MQVVEFSIPEDELLLSPIGDIQYGAGGCDTEKLQRHIQYGVDHGWYFIGMGDAIDTFSPSNRKALQVAGLYESGRDLIDDGVARAADKLAAGPLGGSEGRWLGFLEGDHRHEFGSGEPVDHYLSQCLKTEFLGSSAFVLVKIGDCPKRLVIWAHHGKTTSGTNPTGLTLDFGRKHAIFDADIFLLGHAHQLYTVRRDVLTPVKVGRKWKIKHKDALYAATGSFLNGWVHESESAAGFPRGGYVEEKALTPIPTGAPLISVRPVCDEGFWRFDIRGSS